MAMTLYDAAVLSFRQTVSAVGGVLAKGRAHFEAAGANPDDVVEARIIEDMLPFRFQVASVVSHSVKAIEGCRAGVFVPPRELGPESYAGLEAAIAGAVAALEALSADEVNALVGKDVLFDLGRLKMPFTAENFLMSFSLPNLHFHATTTYDILRGKGVKLSKQDYLGMPRIKT